MPPRIVEMLGFLISCAALTACGGADESSAEADANSISASAMASRARASAVARGRNRTTTTAGTTTSTTTTTTTSTTSTTTTDARCASVTAATCTLASTLGRGINLGNMLEAPVEGQWGIKFDPAYATVIKAAGFNHVRLPVRWTNHASPDAEALLDPIFAARVDEVLGALLNAGLYVVINLHHYRQLDGENLDDGETGVAADVVQARAISVWRQVARRYADRSDHLLFELYNEPHYTQDGGSWNLLYPKLLAAARESNPARAVLVGPASWNAAWALSNFAVPTDRNVIVEVHNYDPYPFTHQGAWGSSYAAGSTTCCTATQVSAFTSSLDTALNWSLSKGFPIYVGEWGSHISAPAVSRVAFAAMARSELESRKMSWAAWNFGADFAVYDTAAKAWNSDLLKALVP